MQRIAIVGASLAGMQAAQALRRQGHEDGLTLIGEEPHYPYDRPPLSKAFLAEEMDVDRLTLRPAVDPDALGIDWRLGSRATGLALADTGDGTGSVQIDGGDDVEFDGLVIATGAAARTLPGTDGLQGVFTLRTLDDALALRAAFDATPNRVLVIGCGFIGAEVAATARGRGLEVTIVEAADTPMVRVLDAEAGMAVADLHRGHGVDVRLGVGVERVLSTDGAVTGATLNDGSMVEATVVVVGIGVTPSVDWLASSGLTLDDGVVTDATGLAAPGVVVAGDVARWPNERFGGRLMRVEQWDNAVEMGGYAAKRLLAWSSGDSVEPFQPVPWFWSDQYDRKIQLAGVPAAGNEIVQGSIAEQRFVQLYLDGDHVTGVLCWNRPRQAIMARQLIEQGAPRAEVSEKLGE